MDREQRREKYPNKDSINKRRKELYALKSAKKATISGKQTAAISGDNVQGMNDHVNEASENTSLNTFANNLRSLRVAEQSNSVRQPVHTDVDFCRPLQSNIHADDLGIADSRMLILPKMPPCEYCGAYKFYKETANFFCSSGEVMLLESVLPEYMVKLITSTDEKSKEFQNMIRTYNNHFASTTIGIHCDEEYQCRNQGIYTVRVQGQIYHFLNDLVPNNDRPGMSGLQFYFYDTDHQTSNRLTALPRLDSDVVENSVHMMNANPYSQFLKEASSLADWDKYEIYIKTYPGLDQRRYNMPTSTEVAGIWIEDENDESVCPEPRDIKVYSKSGQSYRVKNYYGCYDPLQYVLMFPNGEPGWHCVISKVQRKRNGEIIITADTHMSSSATTCDNFDEVLAREENGAAQAADVDESTANNSGLVCTNSRRRRTVSCREYYVYKLQHREGSTSYLLRFGRLLQQYVIDNYVKLETMRLDYFRHNQKRIRMEHYQGIVDSVEAGLQTGAKVGKRLFLPKSFIGGPRDMRNRYLDVMAAVQEFGRPDIFLTMTCNPNWPEIKELLQPGEESQNRPDLVERVFKSKLTILLNTVMSGEVFGEVESVVHVVEFQKRGLPHAHIFIILKPGYKYLTPEAYDRVVCAELPDKHDDPYLYSIVVRHMMHGPCGDLRPSNVCMRDGRCKNHYPKDFQQYTIHGKGNYPNYRRRDDGRRARVRGHTLDNRWVIPYNPTLIAKFNCHMNVEVCCDIRVVKYLYKYIHKGHDKVKFCVAPENSQDVVDEISNFQDARWVSPVEAAWRLFGFPISGMYPPVVQLPVHLPNYHSVRFDDDADLEEVLQNEKFKRTMLTEFFSTNSTDPEAKSLNLLYKDFPRYYVWDYGTRMWTKRKRKTVIGRICTVRPVENERYYLRVLLSNVRCPTSFDYLLTVDGFVCTTFRESAYRRGLLHNDDDVDKTMEEASVYGMPTELRRLFATLLHYCKPADPQGLFSKFYNNMAEDFQHSRTSTNLSDNDILYKVLQGICDTLEPLGRDVNEFHLVEFQYIPNDDDRYDREFQSERSIPVPEEDIYAIHKLNEKQRFAFDAIYSDALSGSGGAYFVDGPGGTGKSYLYKVLLAHIRSQGYIGIIVASSGIGSSNFLGGRTAHSRFKIPIDGGTNIKCQISFQSGEANLIRTSNIIIWDEAPMANKIVIQAVNELLQDLCEKQLPFGGMLVVFGGDFRQVLPIVRGGGRHEQVRASLVSSELWEHFTKLKLTDNMRAKDDPSFNEFLMRIGNGVETINDKDEIEIPLPMLIPYTTMESSLETLINYVYPDMSLFESNPFDMMQRAILCPKNEFVDDINSKLIYRFPGNEKTYVSDDQAKNAVDQGDYIDYLNSLEPRGLPQHKLTLKTNCPVVLLRNINPVEGLCNGTRLICKDLAPNVIGAEIATGQFKGKHVWIPRIPLEPHPGDNKYMIPFVRRQFPLRLCFAMTINKSQGKTLERVGLYLKQPAFSHGQLYVALSRARRGENVKVLILPPVCTDPGSRYTCNIVYNEVLVKAGTA